MYPVGIRVIRICGNFTGTVCLPKKKLHPLGDMSLCMDQDYTDPKGKYFPSGYVWSVKSKNWRPINPDADDEIKVEDEELEEVL